MQLNLISKLALIAFLVLAESVLLAAYPMGDEESGKMDLILCSSYWQDRSPCYVEWYQFNSDGTIFDSRMIRKSNETWTDAAAGDFNGDGKYDILVSLDNDKGFSAIYNFQLDRMGSSGKATVFLPNQPWRHYSAVAVGSFDGDSNPDVLTINLNRMGKTVLEWFEFNDLGKLLFEQVLTPLDSKCSEGVTFGDIDGNGKIDVFVLMPSTGKKDNVIAKYEFDSNGKKTSTNMNWCRIPISTGVLTGLALNKQQGKGSYSLLACAHKIHTLPVVAEKLDKGKYLAETNALLGATDTENDASRIIKIEMSPKGKAGKWTVWMDWMKGRNLRGIAVIPKSRMTAGQYPVSPRKSNAKPEILHVKGLMGYCFQINKAVDLLGGNVTESDYIALERKSGLTKKFPAYPKLLEYDVLVLNNIPVWALSYSQLEMIDAYVRSGGTLIVFDGPMAGAAGGYRGSSLEKMLPCKVSQSFGMLGFKKPVLLDSAQLGYVYYYNRIGKKHPEAVVKMSCSGNPIFLERRLGLGVVKYFTGLPIGKDSADKPGFWNSKKWPEFLANEIIMRKGK